MEGGREWGLFWTRRKKERGAGWKRLTKDSGTRHLLGWTEYRLAPFSRKADECDWQSLALGEPLSEPILQRLADAQAAVGEMEGGRWVEFDGGDHCGALDVLGSRYEVHSRKIGPREFDAMVERLMERSSALPFGKAGAVGAGFGRVDTTERRVLYHDYFLLKRYFDPSRHEYLPGLLEQIHRNPHRRRDEEWKWRGWDEGPEVTPEGLLAAVGGRGRPHKVSGALAESGLAIALKGHLPDSLWAPRTRMVLDTPENRFVKYLLRHLDDICGALQEMDRKGAITKEVEAWREEIGLASSHDMFGEVGEMTYFPASSTVLTMRPGYRQLMELFTLLNMGARDPLDERKWEDLIHRKSGSALYEWWCLLEVFEALAQVMGEANLRLDMDRAPEQVRMDGTGSAWRHAAAWKNGEGLEVRLFYEPTAGKPNGGVRASSYSRLLRPDFMVQWKGPGDKDWAGIVLDAKFRVEANEVKAWGGGKVGEVDMEASKEASGTYQAKVADLYKMHTYRDAISGCRWAVVLFPGNKGGGSKEFLEYKGDWERGGIAAVSCRPTSDDRDGVNLTLVRFLGMALGLGGKEEWR